MSDSAKDFDADPIKPSDADAAGELYDPTIAQYWLPAIVQSAGDAIVSKTLSGIVTSWNPAAERMFGYTAEEMVGQPILKLIPDELRDEEDRILERIRGGRRVDHFDTIRIAKDGRRLHVSLTVSPIKTPEGIVIGASKIARDITEQVYAEEERHELLVRAEEARRQAEAANMAKDSFLAILSHELRTPLHSMKGWATMLQRGVLSEEQHEKALDVIIRGIDAQNLLITDLLDVSRIVSNKLEISAERLSFVAIVQAAIESLRSLAEHHGISLSSEIDPDADSVLGDRDRIAQIITNLISNAVKYTSPGGSITVKLERSAESVVLSVTDTGIGIAPEYLEAIFERFKQTDSSSRRSYGGLGLGLTIARRLAELHGGTVVAASPGIGEGSTFTLSLPFADLTDVQEMAFTSPDKGRAALLEGLRILVLEDDPDSLAMLEISLKKMGAEVTAVSRSEDAFHEIKLSTFDVILSDLGLPDIDGFDMIRKVRKSFGIDGQKLPAIALSGYVGDDDRQRSIEAGFQRHISKPLDLDTLPNIIRSIIADSEEN
jgi:PAS domain S-box-containing protein